ncbi:uncharacterized protein LOC129358099 [Poeciliopsis prolifica]|uniref:uncharacterized protein LOC129358099 n=1 Tax=Poeciliopsis prolifica TaxID=188132 RepID=UPI002413F609|nr:uncharacterized protein LOC129358099 [Poeciliopsis prolifica]
MNPELMQIGHTHLTPEERQKRLISRLCLYYFIETAPLTVPLHVSALDGKALPQIALKTKPLHLIISVPSGPSPTGLQEVDPPDLSSIPAKYHDLAPVFSKTKALLLPPHRPYDCHRSSLPTSRLYNISLPERKTMKKCLKDSLAAGIIHPSSCPLSAGFFFVGKKDRLLKPCIAFRGLNRIKTRILCLSFPVFEPVQAKYMEPLFLPS